MIQPIETVLTAQELAELARQGIKPARYYSSTGEVLAFVGDAPYGYPLDYLRRLANPTLADRIWNWLIGGVA